jgi:uncharacterized protein YdbL (DUF1318 family)
MLPASAPPISVPAPPPAARGRGRRLGRPGFGCLIVAVLATGCSADPRGLLEEMSRTYRAAGAYSDDARVEIRFVRDGREVERIIPFRVAFARPDRVRIDCYDARIAADGTTFHAAVGGVPGQVLEQPVKSPLSLDQIFADEQIRLALAEGDAGCPTQLPLLLADDTVDLILAEAEDKPKFVGTEPVEGHPCTKVEIAKPDGKLVLWIDRRTRLLRRLSLPTGSYARFLTQQGGPVGGLSVVVEFAKAAFPETVSAAAFAFEVPPGAGVVERLEPPPAPQPPSPLVGRRPEPLVFGTLSGGTVSLADLAGTPVVLEFFHAGCEGCRRSMPAVAAGLRDFAAAGPAGAGGLRRGAGSVDEPDVKDEELVAKVRGWGGPAEILRDPRSVAAAAFELTAFPAVVVLAADGTVADVQCGHQHRVGEDLAAVLAAVAAGKPTGGIVHDRFEARLREYQELLARMSAGAGGAAVERLPEQVIAPRRQPDRFKLVRAWRAENVALPGNVLCLDAAASGGARVLVLDGWRTVVELDDAGRELARHELDLPPDAAVSFLRTAVDSAGRRWWLGATRGGQRVFVFDAGWKTHAVYPEWESPPHAGITAADLADLDGDGEIEILVGYSGTVGVQAASLAGKRLWRDRSLDTVLDVALEAAPERGRRGIACVDGRGRIVFLSPHDESAAGRPAVRPATAIRGLFSGPVAPEAAWAFLGLASERLGHNAAVGIGPDGGEEWRLELPAGVHRDGPIEPVAWADLLGTPRRQWLIAAPDGSVTVAWADGRVVDRYRHGSPLTGIGGYAGEPAGTIVIATRDAVEGYRLDDVALD